MKEANLIWLSGFLLLAVRMSFSQPVGTFFDMNNSESNYNSMFKPVEKSILLVEMKEMKRGSLN